MMRNALFTRSVFVAASLVSMRALSAGVVPALSKRATFGAGAQAEPVCSLTLLSPFTFNLLIQVVIGELKSFFVTTLARAFQVAER
jgi:hypothetical protein